MFIVCAEPATVHQTALFYVEAAGLRRHVHFLSDGEGCNGQAVMHRFWPPLRPSSHSVIAIPWPARRLPQRGPRIILEGSGYFG
eukprot:1881373-Alexandrium_andersonii.AAC.1